jgi:hypothetical protein
LPIPIRVNIPDTVEIAMSSSSAMSAPVNRNRLSLSSPRDARGSVRG